MCHDWWTLRRLEEREESRRLWDEFERTTPLSEPERPDEEAHITLERTEQDPVPAER
jgi:hypothetical protein